MMYVKKLDDYYGAMVYALYPSQSTLEDLRGQGLQSYVNSLADWLAMGILSSQSLFKTLISAEPLLLPSIRSGTGRRGWMSSLPARILDDYMICRTRAYYTAHPELFKPRKIVDMEDSEERGRVFIKRCLIPKLREYSESEIGRKYRNEILKLEDCNEINKKYYLKYEKLEKEIGCKPDMVAIILLRNKLLRLLVFEIAETDTQTVLNKKHVMPRILLYMVATYLHYGVPSVGFYISLSLKSSPPALLFVSKGKLARGLSKKLEEIRKLVSLENPPKPTKKPICSHCVYTSTCHYTS